MEMLHEEWRPVNGIFEGYDYLVSNLGRVKRSDGFVIKDQVSFRYKKVIMRRNKLQKSATVHRLVLSAFVRPPRPGDEGNHKDGDKFNNRLDNLEWVTASENQIHSFKVLKRVPSVNGRKFTDDQVREIRQRWVNGEAGNHLARCYNVAYSTMGAILRNITYPVTERPKQSHTSDCA